MSADTTPVIHDRRRYSRRVVESLVYVDLGPRNGGTLLNLSEDGMAVQLAGPVASNQLIRLRFKLKANHRIEASGQIAWTDESGKRAGVRFTNLPEGVKQQIEEWLSFHALSRGLQENIATQTEAVKAKQPESSLMQPDMPSQVPAADSADPIVKEQPDDSATLVREAARRSTVAASVAPLEPGGGVDIGQTEPRVETAQFVGKPSPALTVAVASTDAATTGSLRACLQQTGLVRSVLEWTTSDQRHPGPGERVPDVVLLDISHDLESCLAFAAHLRRLRPAVDVVLYSSVWQLDPELLLQAMRAGVREFLPKPVNPVVLQEILARFAQQRVTEEKVTIGEPIVVLGAKGGVGTTTVAVNLSVQLVQITKKRVVLLDFARPLGHVCLLLDLQPRFSIRDAIESMDRLDGHFLSGLLVRHKSGLEVLAGASHPDDWQQASVPSLDRLVNVAQSMSDFVLMDCGTVYSSEWRGILGLAREVLLITEAHMPDLCALDRHLSALGGLGLESERVRIIINRWHRQDEDTLKAVEKHMKRPIFACLPNNFRQASEAINVGVPLSKNHNDPLTSKYRQLAGQLAGTPLAPGAKRRGPHLAGNWPLNL